MLTDTPTVWVVDDDEDDQLFIRSAFEQVKPPIEILTLNDGDELISKLNETDELPKLVLLDINMTRMNGFDTLRQLRGTPRFAEVPVAMLTTSSNEADRQRSLALGANQYFIKPNNYDKLGKLALMLSQKWALA